MTEGSLPVDEIWDEDGNLIPEDADTSEEPVNDPVVEPDDGDGERRL